MDGKTVAMQAIHGIRDNRLEEIKQENPDGQPADNDPALGSAHRDPQNTIWKCPNYKITQLLDGVTTASFKRYH